MHNWIKIYHVVQSYEQLYLMTIEKNGMTDWLTNASIYEMSWFFKCQIEWFSVLVSFYMMIEFP